MTNDTQALLERLRDKAQYAKDVRAEFVLGVTPAEFSALLNMADQANGGEEAALHDKPEPSQ